MNPQVLTGSTTLLTRSWPASMAPSCWRCRSASANPTLFVNRLYERMRADPTRRLTIVTALSLEKPTGASELERAFLDPIVERVFKDYPDLAYVEGRARGILPAHIEVREFFMKTGDYLHNDAAQQHYICTNYSFAARDMLQQGINVLAQAVAAGDDGALSLQQPRRDGRAGRAHGGDRQTAAQDRLRQRRDALHVGRRGGAAQLLRHRRHRPGGHPPSLRRPMPRSAPWTTPSACTPAAWCAMAARCRSASARWATRSRMR